ncbi:MAG: GDSL-type esterase/lipase family protein [Clostridiaceae bacterium]
MLNYVQKFKKKILKTVSFTLVFVFSISAAAFAQTSSSPKGLDYVALGDSLAAGQNPYGVENGYGYTNIIHNKLAASGLGGSFHNYGVSGYTSQQVLDQLNSGQAGMIQSIKNAEIVTLDVGANDILNVIRAYFSGTASESDVMEASTQAINNIYFIILKIHSINPYAKVYVMGYYDAFINILKDQPAAHAQFVYLLTNPVNGFNTAIEGVAYATGATYVDTMSVMNNPAYLPGDIHPTVDGYNAIATAFVDAIK